MSDFRVRVEATFSIDIGSTDRFHAEQIAKDITQLIFKQSFARAERLRLKALDSFELTEEKQDSTIFEE